MTIVHQRMVSEYYDVIMKEQELREKRDKKGSKKAKRRIKKD